jgi:hypothetical protein
MWVEAYDVRFQCTAANLRYDECPRKKEGGLEGSNQVLSSYIDLG